MRYASRGRRAKSASRAGSPSLQASRSRSPTRLCRGVPGSSSAPQCLRREGERRHCRGRDVAVELSEWSTKAQMVTRRRQRVKDVDIEGADILVGVAVARQGRELRARRAAVEVDGRCGGRDARGRRRRAGTRYAAQIGQTVRRSPRSCTWRSGSPARSSTRSACRNSENILASQDQNAPIFESRTSGVVGDLHKIVPS